MVAGRNMTKRRTPTIALTTLVTLVELPPFVRWLTKLGDSEGKTEIVARIDEARGGNFGDIRLVDKKSRIWEMRIHTGPGYRIYFTHKKDLIYLLLAGGDKDGQKRDIQRAIEIKRQYT
jgi:putative addiction module killer protein